MGAGDRPGGAWHDRLVVLTDRHQAQRPLLEVVGAAVGAGAGMVIVREKDLPPVERARLALAVGGLRPAPRLVVASDIALARQVGAYGVHLAAGDPWPAREEVGRTGDSLLVGRSCHDLHEVREARERGAAYVTLSPVFASGSKPGYGPPLGVEALARICREVPDLPVVALGGVGPDQVGLCLAAGASGVAVMGAVMRAADPASVVGALTRAAARV